jgi:hypothetical protein
MALLGKLRSILVCTICARKNTVDTRNVSLVAYPRPEQDRQRRFSAIGKWLAYASRCPVLAVSSDIAQLYALLFMYAPPALEMLLYVSSARRYRRSVLGSGYASRSGLGAMSLWPARIVSHQDKP